MVRCPREERGLIFSPLFGFLVDFSIKTHHEPTAPTQGKAIRLSERETAVVHQQENGLQEDLRVTWS